ncbi:hypothetical protein QFC20_002005 [Naganishia adeliensis]|uniref:Uncharacterized protein n=1 Tax=Naganishia adeliensis TaxID=92952 RepID=A0ACC2WRG1_9TREE|nr:hypothetical protein QFC20_002005 [Naganishia adeliensis]
MTKVYIASIADWEPEPEVAPRWPDHHLEFNITHDDDMVMLAAESVPNYASLPGIGLDVMRLNRPRAEAVGLEGVLLEQLHPSELATFRRTFEASSAVNCRLDYLIHMWTVKEAYVKAIGTGLGTEFKSLCVLGLDALYEAVHESTSNPSLAPPIHPAWTVKHGYVVVPQVWRSKRKAIPEKCFAWTLVSASSAPGSAGSIDFEIIDCKDFEKAAA